MRWEVSADIGKHHEMRRGDSLSVVLSELAWLIESKADLAPYESVKVHVICLNNDEGKSP
jgi:hypothetical protein